MTRQHSGVLQSIRQAKLVGVSAADTWQHIKKGTASSGMSPACQAMALGDYWELLVKVYGKKATKSLL